MTHKTHIVLHHSATKDTGTMSWDDIERYHVETNGWNAIGYHFGVELIEDSYRMLAGRPMLARAAAAYQRGMNVCGVHICCVGNYDRQPPPEPMLRFLAPHVADLAEALQIPIDTDHIIGHRDIEGVTKSCPGRLFDVVGFVQLLRGVV